MDSIIIVDYSNFIHTVQSQILSNTPAYTLTDSSSINTDTHTHYHYKHLRDTETAKHLGMDKDTIVAL